MTRTAVLVEPAEWERLQAQVRALASRLDQVERSKVAAPPARLTPREVGKSYRISHDIVREACARGELAADYASKGWLIAPADAERWWSQRSQVRRNQ